MRRLLTALAALALTAAPALALGPYYIKPSGNNTLAGTSLGTAWATIAYANANLPQPNTANGDIVVYVDRNISGYAAFPNPVNVPDNGKRYRFIALNFNGINYDENTRIPGGSCLTKTYVSLTGFKIVGSFCFGNTARSDSLSYCYIGGDVDWNGSDYNVQYRNTVVGSHFTTGLSSTGVCIGTKLIESTLTLTASTGNKIFQTGLPEGDACIDPLRQTGADSMKVARVDSCAFQRNHITTICNNANAPGGDFYHRYHYLTAHTLFEDNYWWCKNSGTVAAREGERPFRIRDSCYANNFNRDTVIAVDELNTGGAAFKDFYLSSFTVSPCNRDSSNFDNDWDSCLVITDAAIVWQNGIKRDTLTSNVFVCDQFVVQAGNVVGGLFQSNTIVAKSPQNYGVINFEPATFQGDTTKLYSNIIATTINASRIPASWATAGAAYHDSKGFEKWGKANWNLYAQGDYTNAPGDRSLLWQVDGVGKVISPPGPTTTNVFKLRFPANRRGDADSLSAYGSPQFDQGGPDSLVGYGTMMTFNPQIGAASRAIGIGKGGIDAGARQYVSPPIFTLSRSYSTVFNTGTPGSATSIFLAFTNNGTADLVIYSVVSSDPSVVGAGPEGTYPTGIYLTSMSATHTFVAGEPPRSGTITITTNDPVNSTVVIPWTVTPQEPAR